MFGRASTFLVFITGCIAFSFFKLFGQQEYRPGTYVVRLQLNQLLFSYNGSYGSDQTNRLNFRINNGYADNRRQMPFYFPGNDPFCFRDFNLAGGPLNIFTEKVYYTESNEQSVYSKTLQKGGGNNECDFATGDRNVTTNYDQSFELNDVAPGVNALSGFFPLDNSTPLTYQYRWHPAVPYNVAAAAANNNLNQTFFCTQKNDTIKLTALPAGNTNDTGVIGNIGYRWEYASYNECSWSYFYRQGNCINTIREQRCINAGFPDEFCWEEEVCVEYEQILDSNLTCNLTGFWAYLGESNGIHPQLKRHVNDLELGKYWVRYWVVPTDGSGNLLLEYKSASPGYVTYKPIEIRKGVADANITPVDALCKNGNGDLRFTPTESGTYWLDVLEGDTVAMRRVRNFGPVTVTTGSPISISTLQENSNENKIPNLKARINYRVRWYQANVTQDVSEGEGRFSNGCSKTSGPLTITEPAAVSITDTTPVLVPGSPHHFQCSGTTAPGSIRVHASGGRGTLYVATARRLSTSELYNSTLGASPRSIAVPDSGKYSITLNDANGCDAVNNNVYTVELTRPAPLENASSPVPTLPTCFNGADATARFTTQGGVGQHTLTLTAAGFATRSATGAAGSIMVSGLSPTTYLVTVTDALGCMASLGTVTVPNRTRINRGNVSVQNVSCNGGSNGSYTFSLTGGQPPYTAKLLQGAATLQQIITPFAASTSQLFAGLVAGTFTVQVQDAANCTISDTTISVTQPTPLLAGVPTVTEVTCIGGSDGTASLSFSGGTPYTGANAGYRYRWVRVSDNVTLLSEVGQTPTAVASRAALVAGDYRITAYDANNCSRVVTITVIEPNAVSISNTTSTPPTCPEGSNGSLSFRVAGGRAPFGVIATRQSDGLVLATAGQTGPMLMVNNAPVGTYDIQVTYSAAACSTSKVGEIVVAPPANPLRATPTPISPTCYGRADGRVSLFADRGTPFAGSAYNFSLFRGTIGDAQVGITQRSGVPFVFAGLIAGTYAARITDANGCTVILTDIIVSDPPAISIASLTQQQPQLCPETPNGIARLSLNNISVPFYIRRYGGGAQAVDSIRYVSIAASYNYANLAAGTYTFDAREDRVGGCALPGVRPSVAIGAIAPMVLSSSQTAASCSASFDGRITLSVSSGGTGPYSLQVLDSTGTNLLSTFSTVSLNSSRTVNALRSARYTLRAIDANGCIVNGSIRIQLIAPLDVTTNTRLQSCSSVLDGRLALKPSGGAAGYTVSIFNGASRVAGPAFVTPGDSLVVTNLAALTYSYDVTFAGGQCSTSGTIAVGLLPTIVTSNTSIRPASCENVSDGSIRLTVSAGRPPYTVRWSRGGSAIATQPVTAFAELAGLANGTYDARITDQSGCEQVLSFTVGLKAPPTLAVQVIAGACTGPGNDNQLSIQVTQGTKPYRVRVLNSSNTVISDQTVQSNSVVTNLTPGTYTVQTRDSVNCTDNVANAWLERTITIEPWRPYVVSASVTPVSCFGGLNGIATLSANGGVAPIRFSLNGGPYQPATSFTGLAAGSYTVNMLDANNCPGSGSFVIRQPTALTASILATSDARCQGNANGMIEVTAAGGVSPYQLSVDGTTWINGTILTNLRAGVYTLTVKDANECIFTLPQPVALAEPSALQATISRSANATCGRDDGEAEVSVAGGITPYFVGWYRIAGATRTWVSSQLQARGLLPGLYQADVTDGNTCFVRSSIVTIGNVNGPTGTISNVIGVRCAGEATGSAQVTNVSGNTPISIRWDNGQTTATASGLEAGLNGVTLTDANGCSTLLRAIVPGPAPLVLNTLSLVQPVCTGGCNGTVTVAAGGGTAPFSFRWQGRPGVAGPSLAGLCAGDYEVTVTDANGCQLMRTVSLADPAPVVADLSPRVREVCKGVAVMFDAGNPGSAYQWTSTTGFTSLQRNVSVVQSGKYFVIITTPAGCVGRDSVEVLNTNTGLQANFLISSEGEVEDTLVAIEVSTPEPERTGWVVPAGVSYWSEGYLHLFRFPQPGDYTLRMWAQLGGCTDTLNRSIRIFSKQAGSILTKVDASRFIQSISLYPNPTRGPFSVDLTLREKTKVLSRVYSASSIQTLNVIRTDADKKCKLEFDQSGLSAGVYFLHIEAGGETQLIRLVVL